MNEQQKRCMECRWCCENEGVSLPNASDRTLHVGWLKGMRQIWIPWSKHWMVIIDNTACKYISANGCAIYDNDTRPYVCSEWMCQTPVLTYARIMPILERASQRILDRKFKNWKRSGEIKTMENKRLVIGCGSGRCGTSSLSALLNSQLEACITHECGVPLPWYAIDRPYDMSMALIKQYPHKVVGDVAFWYLKYVANLVKDFPNVRIVCLQRNREDTVKSLMKCADKFGASHCIDEFSEYYDFDKWPLEAPDAVALRACFPKYNAPAKEAYGHYWDEYYYLATECQKMFPKNFKIFGIEALNEHQRIVDLLRFCGFDMPVVVNYNLQKEVTV